MLMYLLLSEGVAGLAPAGNYGCIGLVDRRSGTVHDYLVVAIGRTNPFLATSSDEAQLPYKPMITDRLILISP